MAIGRVNFVAKEEPRSLGRRLVRFGLRLVLGLGVLLGGVLVWLSTGVQSGGGTLRVPGLGASVTVTRDADGIPYIRAATADDAWRALGALHARDRLAQMELMRRSGSGRLAEVVGSRALDLDRMMRGLGLRRSAERALAAASPEFRAVLERYAEGVNAAVAGWDGPLPPEFALTFTAWEPWTPVDSLLWGKVMALWLSGNARTELQRAGMLRNLGPEALDDFFPMPTADQPVTLGTGAPGVTAPAPRGGTGLAPLPESLRRSEFATLLEPLLRRPEYGRGASNAWVLGPDRTDTGGAILANDPHLPLGAPVMWYLAHIEAPGLTLTGATVPGVPMLVVGHNGQIAWGFTTTHSDTMDVVVERVDPTDPGRYLTPSGPRPFESRTEDIVVAFGATEQMIVRETRFGPVMSDAGWRARVAATTAGLERAGILEAGSGSVLVLAWPALSETDRSMEAVWLMNRATDWTEFLAAARLANAPQQNVFFADRKGGIGMVAPGLVPVRIGYDGRLPVPGWDREKIWSGFVPFEGLPQAYSRTGGRIVNANNRVVPTDSPWYLGDDWQEPYRARRILERLDERPRSSVDHVASIQLDTVSVQAREALPKLLALLAESEAARDGAAGTPLSGLAAHARGLLANWGGDMLRTRPEPLVYLAVVREILTDLVAAPLGRGAEDFAGWNGLLLDAALSGRSPLCRGEVAAAPASGTAAVPADAVPANAVPPDAVPTSDPTSATTPVATASPTPAPAPAPVCVALVRAAFTRAVDGLVDAYGADPAAWRWGAVHRSRFRHLLLGQVPLIGGWFGTEVESSGDDFTVNRGTPVFAAGRSQWRHVHGPGLRVVFDLADLDRSRFMIASGQSGHPFSRLFTNLTVRWRDGASVALPRTRPGAPSETLMLVP